jgi:hypothetical protein
MITVRVDALISSNLPSLLVARERLILPAQL